MAAIHYVGSRSDVDPARVCLWGQSMGGQLAIVAASLAGEQKVRAVVAEATYASYRHHVKDKVARLGPLWLVQWGAWLFTSDQYAAEDAIADLSPVPVLLVHGTADRAVEPYHSERLFGAARDPKDIWLVEGVGHLEVFEADEYRNQVVAFFRLENR